MCSFTLPDIMFKGLTNALLQEPNRIYSCLVTVTTTSMQTNPVTFALSLAYNEKKDAKEPVYCK